MNFVFRFIGFSLSFVTSGIAGFVGFVPTESGRVLALPFVLLLDDDGSNSAANCDAKVVADAVPAVTAVVVGAWPPFCFCNF